MGQPVTVLPGFNNVWLPVGAGGTYDAGDTVVLTDAEFATLTDLDFKVRVLDCSASQVPDPDRSAYPLATSVSQAAPYIQDLDLRVKDIESGWLPYDVQWVSLSGPTTLSAGQPSINDGTLVGRYKQVGTTVFVTVEMISGESTDFGDDIYTVTLPVAANDDQQVLLNVGYIQYDYPEVVQGQFGSIYGTFYLGAETYGPGGGPEIEPAGPGSNLPFEWYWGAQFLVSGTYEAAVPFNINADVVSGSDVLENADTSALRLGDLITGYGIATGTYVSDWDSNSILLSQNAIATKTGVNFTIEHQPQTYNI